MYQPVTNQSFDNVTQWLSDVKQLAGPETVVMLIGNKADAAVGDRRAVSHNEASLFAQEQNLLHFETSAATGDFVNDAFLKVAKIALERQQKDTEVKNDDNVDMN